MWRAKYLESVAAANAFNKQYEPAFSAFELAARRAVSNIQDAIDPEYVKQLEKKCKELEDSGKVLVEQLNQAQKRAREMNEEQYMRTHAVQDLSDEILALNMQLNASEKKHADLEQENAKLVQRWVERVNVEAGGH